MHRWEIENEGSGGSSSHANTCTCTCHADAHLLPVCSAFACGACSLSFSSPPFRRRGVRYGTACFSSGAPSCFYFGVLLPHARTRPLAWGLIRDGGFRAFRFAAPTTSAVDLVPFGGAASSDQSQAVGVGEPTAAAPYTVHVHLLPGTGREGPACRQPADETVWG